jgi:uncharacterized protein
LACWIIAELVAGRGQSFAATADLVAVEFDSFSHGGPSLACVLDDCSMVEQLLGRRPTSKFEVVVRDTDGWPAVLLNAPFLDDGTPMPTLYWLVGKEVSRRVGRLEADGGVNLAEAEVDPVELAAAHDAYRKLRDALIPDDHVGPRPSGGVAGTRIGVKCLHAHYAWFLAGGNDPVGAWVARHLTSEG